MTRMVKRTRPRTRAKLLDGARSVFADAGVEGATVSDIAGRAGYTRGAFYSNFQSKEEILLAVLEEIAEQQIGAVRNRVRSFVAEHGGANWRSALHEVLGGASIDRQTVLLLIEMQLHAVRSQSFADAYLSLLGRLETEVAEAASEFAATAQLQLTVEAAHAGRALCSLWLSSATLAVVRDDEQDTRGDVFRGFVETLFAT